MYLRASCMMLLLGGALAACGPSSTTYQFTGSEVAAGADADLKLVERDQNYELDLKVDNLLPPERAHAGANTYAVWIQPPGKETPTHLGNLQYNDNNRRGELRTVTPHHSFEMFVTAEQSTTPGQPQGPKVLSETVKEY